MRYAPNIKYTHYYLFLLNLAYKIYIMDSNGTEDVPNSCGIKKIVDCKIMNGQQMYQVKWMPTWEPAENLATCQHLVDDFWSHVNKVKTHEEKAIQHKKRIKLEPNFSNINFPHLPADNKAEVHQLIARTNETTVGLNPIQTPSNMFNVQQLNNNGTLQMHKEQKHSVKTEKFEHPNKVDALKGDSAANSKIAASGLRYIESFDNPYVKIVVVCKICNKEQSLKIAGSWKQHYFTHTDQKPHTCPHCSKGFLRPVLLRNHIKSKHPEMAAPPAPSNHEQQMYFKQEGF